MAANAFTEIEGREKDSYLSSLDNALQVLVLNLKSVKNGYVDDALRRFGDKNKWNWQRLPREMNVNARLADMVQTVRENYAWLGDSISENETLNNRAYFDAVELSTESGLPWIYSFMQLHKLQKGANDALAGLPGYEKLASDLREVLLEDKVPIGDVAGSADRIHRNALKRNYLEQLAVANLLNWEAGEKSRPLVVKIADQGSESLWSISYIRFSPATGTFHCYIIDAWQDILNPLIFEDEISPRLDASLQFGEGVPAFYMLASLDHQFSSLHPVHVSRGIIGPFESKYIGEQGRLLGITAELLEQDPNAMLLRFKRQYALAPNHQETSDGLRQIIYRQDWNDEVIVAPAQYASRVAHSLEGTSVRIFQT